MGWHTDLTKIAPVTAAHKVTKHQTIHAHWARIAYGNTSKKADRTVRKTASSKGKKVSVIRNGGKVLVLGTSGKYYKVQAGNKTGYILKKAVYAQRSASVKKKVFLTKNAGKGRKLLTVTKGKKVTVIGSSGKYLKVKYGNKTGYVKKAVCKFQS
jgi:membrane-bound ClpP family serine protease